MVAAALASFIIVALGTSIAVVLVGVVCASISAGLGEITFLALTARYNKYVDAYFWSKNVFLRLQKNPIQKKISAITSKHYDNHKKKFTITYTIVVMVNYT